MLVFKMDSFYSIIFGDDYEETREYYHLDEYNILIFDPKYNYLNKYNKRINGTDFNGKLNATYLFTKNTTLDLSIYNKIYHIFLMNYNRFKNFNIPENKQFINLYPGGGYADAESLLSISKDCNIISTQRFTTERLNRLGFTKYVEILGSPLLLRGSTAVKKPINNGTLNVCFSSVADIKKGMSVYKELAISYKHRHPTDDVIFNAVGICSGDNIVHHNPMSMIDLNKFYQDKIDIMCNFSDNPNGGFPLGAEASLNGAVLITSDVNKVANMYSFSDELLVSDDISASIKYIKMLYVDREKLNKLSHKLQEKMFDDFSYENQMLKRYQFLNGGCNVFI